MLGNKEKVYSAPETALQAMAEQRLKAGAAETVFHKEAVALMEDGWLRHGLVHFKAVIQAQVVCPQPGSQLPDARKAAYTWELLLCEIA